MAKSKRLTEDVLAAKDALLDPQLGAVFGTVVGLSLGGQIDAVTAWAVLAKRRERWLERLLRAVGGGFRHLPGLDSMSVEIPLLR